MDIWGASKFGWYFLTMDGKKDVGDFDKSDVIAIMACGWVVPDESLNYLRLRLWREHGIPSRLGATFQHLNIFPYERLGIKLARCIRKTAREYPGKKIILIGQSLGGNACIAAYKLLSSNPLYIDRISAIFVLGSPFYGVQTPILRVMNRQFKLETRRIFGKYVTIEKVISIHARYDEMVPIWHSWIDGTKPIFVDTGFDTLADKILALLFPIPTFFLSFIPKRHMSLAFSPQVPGIIKANI